MGAVGIEETPLGDLARVRPLSRLDSKNSKSVLDLHCNDKMAGRLLACGLHPFNTSRMMVDVISCHHAPSSPVKRGGNQVPSILDPESLFVPWVRTERKPCAAAEVPSFLCPSELRPSSTPTPTCLQRIPTRWKDANPACPPPPESRFALHPAHLLLFEGTPRRRLKRSRCRPADRLSTARRSRSRDPSGHGHSNSCRCGADPRTLENLRSLRSFKGSDPPRP